MLHWPITEKILLVNNIIMNIPITDSNREKDILDLCKSVIGASAHCYDDPNGPYTTTCPFCKSKWYGDYKKSWATMSEISHYQDCAYTIAKDLSTGLI